MEGKISKDFKSKISQSNKSNSKSDYFRQAHNRVYFNSVTGEQINVNDGDESDMYEVIPDMEQYANDNISQYTDICEKDKQFFKLWNSFVRSKENAFLKFEEVLINFLNLNCKYLYENDLRKNFILHLVAVYDNKQIDDENLQNIKTKSLVFVGSKERSIMIKSAKKIHNELVNSELEILSGYYHGDLSINHAKEYVSKVKKLVK